MPRRLIPRKVGEITNARLGVTVDLMLDRNTLEFFAELGDLKITNKSADTVKAKMGEAIRAVSKLDWFPVVHIEQKDAFMSGGLEGFVGFKTERFWMAKKPNGRLTTLPWNRYMMLATSEMETRWWSMVRDATGFYWENNWGKFELPCSEGKNHYLPYTDELWAGTERLITAIKLLRERLIALISSEEGIKQLVSIGASMIKALPAPKGEEHDTQSSQHR